jgi:hypothetical protein
LARQLQKVIAVAACWAATVAAQTFAHQEALAGTKGSCQPCHAPVLKLTEVSKKERPVKWIRFNHELHLKLGNPAPVLLNAIETKAYLPGLGADPDKLKPHLEAASTACAACHRGMAAVSGKLAKENYPHMSDCLVCHNKIDNPFSCEKCHVEEPRDLRPASHAAPGFADGHSAKTVAKAECAVCHGRKFTCLGCH